MTEAEIQLRHIRAECLRLRTLAIEARKAKQTYRCAIIGRTLKRLAYDARKIPQRSCR